MSNLSRFINMVSGWYGKAKVLTTEY